MEEVYDSWVYARSCGIKASQMEHSYVMNMILSRLEEAGMLPPERSDIIKRGIYEWEPEDE